MVAEGVETEEQLEFLRTQNCDELQGFLISRPVDAARIVVKPTWRDYHPSGNELVLEIDPGMAFGTGTHPTTALCLGELDGMALDQTSVVDYGCGSGILAVAALRLGAARALGGHPRRHRLRPRLPPGRAARGLGLALRRCLGHG